ncbi:UDP-N-acetylmuramoyl-L-alanine--D-glutamate ligase [Opitutus sp. ER46]|uniref:UDP-N-acetylmuramoyl-L-alanine--D-glutamate ligase n=1 Tax=Opitutus sp. ER46 TaxID=2161864 RepID=UPI000D327E91|nr:UDP-N-acetylmuramoyl-L-alanine--D-glutamate ligase [Opitutus sp. ER46]PTX90795.1 UDP-N-acetylmuramoyl-L-alanine--D-glutamate ligase [Opitutus sp. ER46]
MAFAPSTFLSALLERPVAVFGAGVSGDGVRALLGALGATAQVYDAKGMAFDAAAARAHKLVVFSPGFVPDHPWLVAARGAGATCLGELDFAALCWRGRILAVTGTNGKTTLTEFLTHALQTAGFDAVATGNIGHSFSAVAAERAGGTPETIAVCEVSSFQAETIEHLQATSTLWTNFAEDHLERHPWLEAYFAAKWNLVAHTQAKDATLDRPNFAPGAFIGSSVQHFAGKFGCPTEGVNAVATIGVPIDERLVGTVFGDYPQWENFLLAKAWWREARLDEAQLISAARTFKLGRHRLARVAEIEGVTFWNDSKATNFHAVEAALGRFTAPVVLIAGGKAKGGDLGGFVRRLAGRVHHVVLIGATGAELARHCAAAHVPHTSAETLARAVPLAAQLAPRGGHVLLSPAFASFDQFRSYEDRGEQFEKLVETLAATPAVTKAARDPI